MVGQQSVLAGGKGEFSFSLAGGIGDLAEQIFVLNWFIPSGHISSFCVLHEMLVVV